jgi:hypothetical protein
VRSLLVRPARVCAKLLFNSLLSVGLLAQVGQHQASTRSQIYRAGPTAAAPSRLTSPMYSQAKAAPTSNGGGTYWNLVRAHSVRLLQRRTVAACECCGFERTCDQAVADMADKAASSQVEDANGHS